MTTKNYEDDALQQEEHTTKEEIDLCLIAKLNKVIDKAYLIECHVENC